MCVDRRGCTPVPVEGVVLGRESWKIRYKAAAPGNGEEVPVLVARSSEIGVGASLAESLVWVKCLGERKQRTVRFAFILTVFPTLAKFSAPAVASFVDARICSLHRHRALPRLIGETGPTPRLECSSQTIGSGRTLWGTCRTISRDKKRYDKVRIRVLEIRLGHGWELNIRNAWSCNGYSLLPPAKRNANIQQ